MLHDLSHDVYNWSQCILCLVTEIEAQVRALQEQRAGLSEQAAAGGGPDDEEEDRVGLGERGHFDTDIYGGSKSKFAGYVTSIAATDEPEVTPLLTICFGFIYNITVCLFSKRF